MKSKQILKDVLQDAKFEAKRLNYMSRNFRFEENANYVFMGIRRAGKSYLMFQRMHELVKKGVSWDSILYVNFEDERLEGFTAEDFNTFLEIHYELYNTEPICFFDEIQNVAGWEKFVRRLADSQRKVYVTGSNAKMLSSDVATTLGGRFLIQEVYPYDFSEFLKAQFIPFENYNSFSTVERAKILNAFDMYFYFGGFPELLLMAYKRNYLTSIYQKIYLGDIIARYKISNVFALRIMVKKIAESIKQPLSYNRIANIITATGNKIGTSTVINYMENVKGSWLLLSVQNIAAKIAQKESSPKYYFTDNGLLNLFLTDPETSLLENLVAITLIKKYGKQDEVFFYEKNIEVDFYIPNESLAVQVCYSIENDETLKREVTALKKISEVLPCKKMLIVTRDNDEIINKDGMIIEVVSAWKWLLEMSA